MVRAYWLVSQAIVEEIARIRKYIAINDLSVNADDDYLLIIEATGESRKKATSVLETFVIESKKKAS